MYYFESLDRFQNAIVSNVAIFDTIYINSIPLNIFTDHVMHLTLIDKDNISLGQHDIVAKNQLRRPQRINYFHIDATTHRPVRTVVSCHLLVGAAIPIVLPCSVLPSTTTQLTTHTLLLRYSRA